MRVLALVTDAFGGAGGIAAYNRHFLSALGAGGAEVEIVPRMGRAGVLPQGLVQHAPRAGKIAYVAHLTRLLARSRSFDLVWCGHLGMTPIGALASRLAGCPCWLQIHGIEAWGRPGGTIGAAVSRVELVTAVSRYTRRKFLSWAAISPETVRVLPNCVGPEFTPGPRRADLVERHDLAGKRVLLTISRLSSLERYKGHDLVIDALPELVRRFPDLVYIIGGDGDDRARLEALAARRGVAGHCRFTGWIADEDIVDYHRLADAFVMPSTGEGFGIVYLEAMSCGVPGIGLDCDGSLDPLSACRLGHAVPREALTEAIVAALTSRHDAEASLSDLQPFSVQSIAAQACGLAERLTRREGAPAS